MNVNWDTLIAAANCRRPPSIKADEYLCTLRPKSWRPVKLRGSDNKHYAVKALGISHDNLPTGRTMFNEHVAGRLGNLIRAPVPGVELICMSQQLIDRYQLQPRLSGLAHGSRFIENCKAANPKHEILHQNERDNRARFARIAIFLGWTNGSNNVLINDAEFIYDEASHEVYCIDFGNFLCGPDGKDSIQLQSKAVPNAWVKDKCQLSDYELAQACEDLRSVTPEQIAEAVAAPPKEWSVHRDERVELAKQLHRRQAELVNSHSTGDKTQNVS